MSARAKQAVPKKTRVEPADRPKQEVVPGAFFKTQEWRGWVSCRRPRDDYWDESIRTFAQLQRLIGQLFQLQYEAEARVLAADSGAGAVRRKRAAANLADLEAEARAKMAEFDLRINPLLGSLEPAVPRRRSAGSRS